MAKSAGSTAPFDPRETYVELADAGSGTEIPVTPDFWPEVMSGQRRIDGRLVTAFRIAADIDHWESHPKGEELLIALSGQLLIVLETADGQREVLLSAGLAVLVPRGVWHTIRVREPGDLIAITAGEGTEHRPA
jgi:mannose-6-phosphate isomerase-like protein (cupin superfamily)